MAGSDPNKLLVKADKLTRLSLTRWSADWKSATLLYEQAANGFRIAKDYEKAKEALEKASKGQELISSPWDAAKHMESAAALAKELGKWNEVADFYKRASELYAECGRPQPASDALAKGARALEDSMPDEAIQLYTDACAILEEDGKEQMAFDLYRDATSVYIKNEKYTDAAALMLRFGVSADKCNATHSQCKAYLGAIIIYLYLHDIKQAEQCYNDCTQKSKQSHNIGWLESRVWSPWCPRKSKIKKPTSWRGLQIQSKTKQNKKRERKMQRAVVQVNSISALKVCPNHAGKITQLTRKLIPPFPPTTSSPQLPNPCVDLYFRNPVEEPYFDSRSISEYQQTLVQKLLPQAWSHDPLTTLKLIFHLPDEPFYAAAVWLHHNHPKTLACNLLPIADNGGIASVFEILSRLDAGHSVDDYPWTWTRMLYNISRQQNFCANPFVFRSSRVETTKKKASALLKRRKTIAMANKVAERYDRDPHYRFLHDRVSDLIAECLKYDIQELNKLKHKQQQQQQQQGEEGQEVLELKITSAASYCPSRPNSSKAPRPTGLLYESIARKFPLGIRLRKEVLVPLRQAMASRKSVQDDANPWGYDYHPFPRTECPIFKYMLELNEAIAAKSKSVPELIETGAVLPHQILRYAWKFEQAAELLWERMVEDLHQKQGKLNNCLVVCNVDKSSWFCSEAGPLGLLVSRLNSQDPWKGKVVSYTRNPRMHLIPPAKDLRSKCKFMGSWEEKDWWDKDWEKEVDVVKVVFDLILEVAVKENVKPEQMINKVFMFKEKYRHKDITWSGIRSSIFCAYKEIQRRFEAKGYKVPHLMIWSMNDRMNPLGLPECSAEQGVTLLRGFSDNLVKSFLDNDGEVGPEEIMEAAISNEKYQALAVVD